MTGCIVSNSCCINLDICKYLCSCHSLYIIITDIHYDVWEDAKHRQVYILHTDLHLAVYRLDAWEDEKHLQVYILLRRCADELCANLKVSL